MQVMRAKRGFTLIELMIVVAIIGLLAALAIPNFLKFQAKSKQSEARANLKSVYTAQKAYYGDKQMYYDIAGVIGFSPESANRYTYRVGSAGNTETRTCGANPLCGVGASTACPTGPQGCQQIEADEKWTNCGAAGYAVPAIAGMNAGPSGVTPNGNPSVFPAGTCCPQGQCEFTAAASGNIDNDAVVDVWAISSAPTVAAGPTAVCGANVGRASEGEPMNLCNDVDN